MGTGNWQMVYNFESSRAMALQCIDIQRQMQKFLLIHHFSIENMFGNNWPEQNNFCRISNALFKK